MHFSKNLVVCSSAGPKILASGSHWLANFQPILDYFMPNFKLKYEDSENIKADRVSAVVFNLHQIKRRAFFFSGHSVVSVMIRHSDNFCPAPFDNTKIKSCATERI